MRKFLWIILIVLIVAVFIIGFSTSRSNVASDIRLLAKKSIMPGELYAPILF